MSSFRELKCSQMVDEATLIAALKKLGYSPVVKDGQTVRGDTRSDNRDGYEITLKKEDTGFRGDIGFHKTKDGYSVGYDSYIIPASKFDSKVITGAYTVEKARRTALKLNLFPVGETKIQINGKSITRLVFEQRN